MSYVEGFLAAVPTANREVYERYAREVWAIMKDHGAVEMVDCWGDDVPMGTLTSFPRAVQCTGDETVVFGWTLPLTVGLIGVPTVLYTMFGGVQAVAWADELPEARRSVYDQGRRSKVLLKPLD